MERTVVPFGRGDERLGAVVRAQRSFAGWLVSILSPPARRPSGCNGRPIAIGTFALGLVLFLSSRQAASGGRSSEASPV